MNFWIERKWKNFEDCQLVFVVLMIIPKIFDSCLLNALKECEM